MSKELTEKWKKKELKDGDYYVLNKAGDIVCDYYIEILGHFDSVLTENVKEVLAPVPSYDEYKQLVSNSDVFPTEQVLNLQKMIEDECFRRCELERRLDIAIKALERYSKDDYYSEGGGRSVNPYPHIARKALKEMEGVK